jgi:DNA-binding Lrp family transcriptional regulator
MTVAFVLIKMDPAHRRDILYKLTRIKEITERYAIASDYDILVKVETRDLDLLGEVVVEKIRKIQGISDTETLTVTILF